MACAKDLDARWLDKNKKDGGPSLTSERPKRRTSTRNSQCVVAYKPL